MQPTNLKSSKFQEELKCLGADIQIVVAFRMLPEKVWNMPPLGTYNLHGSLLPKYRGAAPINWAIINGEKKTGVTSFKLKHAIDTGNIHYKKEVPIYPDDTAGDLHDRMMWVAAEIIYDTVTDIQNDKIDLKEQDESEVSHAPKLTKENTQINLTLTGQQILNHIRGLNPYPTAWTLLDGQPTKIYLADFEQVNHHKSPGHIETNGKDILKMACSDGYLIIMDLKMSGKKRMKTYEFLNGYKFKESL